MNAIPKNIPIFFLISLNKRIYLIQSLYGFSGTRYNEAGNSDLGSGKKQPYEALLIVIFYRKKRLFVVKNDDISAKLVEWVLTHHLREA